MMENGLRPASELDDETIEEMVRTYLGGVMPFYIIGIAVTAGLVVCAVFSRSNILHVIAWGFGGVMLLFLITSLVSALIAAGRIRNKRFAWTKGTVTKHRIAQSGLSSHNVYLFTVIDGQYMCNTWCNPWYGKGTEVYYIETRSKLGNQPVVARVR